MKKSLEQRMKEKKEKEKRIARYWQNVSNNKIKNKADELNKIMSRKDVIGIVKDQKRYSVTFKNGQVFNFTFLPPAHLLENKIIPILEGVSYGKGR